MTVAIDDDGLDENDPRRRRDSRMAGLAPESHAGAQLAEAGLVAPHLPQPWGLGADADHQLIIDDELRRANVRLPINPIGIGWAGPTILYAGTEDQQQRWLPKLLSGEEFWCQLFSEPNAGSDLASLTTQRRARRRRVDHLRSEGLDQLRPPRDVGHLARAHVERGCAAEGHQLLHLPDERAGHHDSSDHRHHRRPRLQRGLPRRGPTAGRLPHRRGQRRVAPRQGHAGQRTRLALRRGRALGPRPDRRGPGRTGAHVRRSPTTHSNATNSCGVGRTARSCDCCDCDSSPRPRPDESPAPRPACARRSPTTTAKRSWSSPTDSPARRACSTGRGPGGVDGADGSAWAFGFLYSQALTIGGGTSAVQRNIIGERVLGLPRTPASLVSCRCGSHVKLPLGDDEADDSPDAQDENGRTKSPDPAGRAMACCIPLTIGSSGRYDENVKSHCGKRFGARKTPLTKLRMTTVKGPTEPGHLRRGDQPGERETHRARRRTRPSTV